MKQLFSSLLTSLALFAPALAQDAERPALEQYNLSRGLALSGYDPVGYFAQGGGKPQKGDKDLSASHRGVTYRFANERNRAAFVAAPEAFEPAYGGWCAYAMAKGKQVEVDPKSYLIENGRLLVFYDGLFNDTRKKWGKEGPAELGPKADAAWKRFSGEDGPRDVSHFNLRSGVGLKGYDPVAYRSGAAREGSAKIEATHAGVRYHFATEANRTAFLAAPAGYEPRYGGWCAWAMSQGKQVAVDPAAYALEGRALYVFYNAAKRDEWKGQMQSMLKSADRHWAELTMN